MELTGKCKEDFEKWYSYHIYSDTHHIFGIQEFYNAIPKSMQYGVYVDFFDGVGIYVTVSCEGKERFDIDVWSDNFFEEEEFFNTRKEARTKAIEAANEIYNQTK